MPDLGYHMMFRSDDDRVLAPSPDQRRVLARSVYRVAAGFPLAAFGAADNHLHLEVLGDRATAGRLAHRMACSLHWSLGLTAELAPVRYKPLADQGHKRSTFHYALNQRNHHGIQCDPYLDASSLPELLGMRVLNTGDTLHLVREHFPRLQRHELLRHLGPRVFEPACDEQLRALVDADRFDLLRDAAAGAVGMGTLQGRQPVVVAARTTLVQLLSPCCRPGLVGDVVALTDSAIRRSRARPTDPTLQRAVRLQVTHRLWLLDAHPELLALNPSRLPEARVHNPHP
jgi:hypothetical protein